jgi:FMN phosphatase YigB (HAD superfamily)
MIEKIYLDMDGVIADFSKKYRELYKIYPHEAETYKTFDKFFNRFIEDREFAKLDLMPDTMMLIEYLKSLSIPTEILSSTSSEKRDAVIREQKLEWLKNHGIDFPAILVPGKRHKKNYSNAESLLIDDTEQNINQWREAGGVAIHHKDVISTLNILKGLLNT